MVIIAVLLACSLNSYWSSAGDIAVHRETILFAVSGFTNKTGDSAVERERAVQAAVALAKKQVGSLFSAPDNADSRPALLTATLKDRIELFEVRDLPAGVTGSSLVGVRIVGKVAINIPPLASPYMAKSSAPLLNASISTGKTMFTRGEQIVFFIDGNMDFFACILDRNEQGEIVQLLPNSLRSDNRFSGNRQHRFPDPAKGDNYDLEASPPFGRETIYLIASPHQFAPPLPVHRQLVFASSKEDMDLVVGKIDNQMIERLKRDKEDIAFRNIQVTTRVLFLTTQEGK